MKSFSPTLLLIFTLLALGLAPMASAGVLVGAESNGEIVNSNVTPEGQRAALLKMHRQGTQLVRANFGWNELAAACGGQSVGDLYDHTNPCYNWRLMDSFAKTNASLGMKSLVSITRAPSWASGSLDPHNMGSSPARFAKVVDHYAALHAAAGARYRLGSVHGTIQFWTIHNESNSATFWKPRPSADRYGLLYARAATALKATHPTAKVAPGPTNPTGNGRYSIKPLVFTRDATAAIYKYLPGSLAQKRRYVDAWAHNPYPGAGMQPHQPAPATPAHVVGMAKIGSLIVELDRHPLTRKKPVWATEFGWETSGAAKATTELRQAQFIAEAYDWFDAKRRVTIAISYGLTDPVEAADWQSGTYRANGRAKPSVRMMQRMISAPGAGTAGKVKRGTVLALWGKSNIAPQTGQIIYRAAGSSTWRVVPGQRRALDGSIRVKVRMSRPMSFAVKDSGSRARSVGAGMGIARMIKIS